MLVHLHICVTVIQYKYDIHLISLKCNKKNIAFCPLQKETYEQLWSRMFLYTIQLWLFSTRYSVSDRATDRNINSEY